MKNISKVKIILLLFFIYINILLISINSASACTSGYTQVSVEETRFSYLNCGDISAGNSINTQQPEPNTLCCPNGYPYAYLEEDSTYCCLSGKCGRLNEERCGTGWKGPSCVSGLVSCNGICKSCCPSCSGKSCGSNGCGGSCGTCQNGYYCSNGNCVASCSNDCSPSGSKTCSGTGFKTCGHYDGDPCLEWSSVSNCNAGYTCSNGNCINVDPNTKQGCESLGFKWIGSSGPCCGNEVSDCGSIYNPYLCSLDISYKNPIIYTADQLTSGDVYVVPCNSKEYLMLPSSWKKCDSIWTEKVIHGYLCNNSLIFECTGVDTKYSNLPAEQAKARGEKITFSNVVYYCDSNADWVTTLDHDKNACQAAGFTYTGTYCCGETPEEYYNDMSSGCWNSIVIPNNTLVSQNTNPPYMEEVLFYSGAFKYCINPEVNDILISIIDSHTGQELLTHSQVCTNFGRWFCSYSTAWKNNLGLNKSHYSRMPWSNYSAQKAECCQPTECWSGNQCVTDQASSPKSMPYYSNHRCVDGNWKNSTLKFDWNYQYSGYCPSEDMCLVNTLEDRQAYLNNGDPSKFIYLKPYNPSYSTNPQCINNSQFILDHYCLDGNWSLRTKLLALELLKFADRYSTKDYTLHCDEYSRSLSKWDYYFRDKDMMDLIANDQCLNNGASCVNSLCVLKHTTGKGVIIGTSLNEPIDANTEYSFLSALGKEDTQLDYCNEAAKKTVNKFYPCENNDVWYNPITQTIIYLKDPNDLSLLTDMFVDSIKSKLDDIINFIIHIWKPSYVGGTKGKINLDFLDKLNNFNRVFISSKEEKTIQGAIEKVNRTTFLTAKFTGFESDICNSVNLFNIREPGFEIYIPGFPKREGIDEIVCKQNLDDNSYIVFSKKPSGSYWIGFDAWEDLTINSRLAEAKPAISPYGNLAEFVFQNVPSTMLDSQNYQVTIIMKNTGTTTWTRQGAYKLGSQNPQDNLIWGLSRVVLADIDSIDPDQEKTFIFSVKAPSTPGMYKFKWRMLQENVEWFGESTPNVDINVTWSCSDYSKGQYETDIDCGGQKCPKCGYGKTCILNSDCSSDLCENNLCTQEPTCFDQIKNQDETDIDCGGICDPCIDGKTCNLDSDCESLYCESIGDRKICVSCRDSQQNQDETDIDCGGLICSKCQNGDSCAFDSDCMSGLCFGRICTESANCFDQIKNQDETDIDCGGLICPKCIDGKNCLLYSDCESLACENRGDMYVCVSCSDNLKNQDETDIDCGGQKCQKCANNKVCNINSDCQSAYCLNGLCKPLPTCTDSVKNQDETDIDCGGSICPKCTGGKVCNLNSDCQSDLVCVGTPKMCMKENTNTISRYSVSAKDGTINKNLGVGTSEGYLTFGNDNGGKIRGFIYFDTSTIPANSQITSATLSVNGFNFARCECDNTGTIEVYQCGFDPLDGTDYAGCTPGPGPVNTGVTFQLSSNSKCPLGTRHSVSIPVQYITKAGPTQFKLKTVNEACVPTEPLSGWYIAPFSRICSVPPGWGSDVCDLDNDRPTLTVGYNYYTII